MIGLAPLDYTGCQLRLRLVAAGKEKRTLAIGPHAPFGNWGRFLSDQPTAVSLLDRLCRYARAIIIIITASVDIYWLTHRTT